MTNCKQVLCWTMLNNGECQYGDECLYAHSLMEQKVSDERERAYAIIKSKGSLDSIDLIKDIGLYTTLKQMTKSCILCRKHICIGGYNCRNGVLDTNKICPKDLMNGDCDDEECKSLHLTKRGLVPFNQQKEKESINSNRWLGWFWNWL